MGLFKARLVAGAIVVLVLAVPASAQAVVLTVDSNADNSTNDGLCTLREAVTSVNTNADVNGADDCDHDGASGTDTISLAAGTTYSIASGGSSFDLDLNGGNVIIDGFSAGSTTVDANDEDRVFTFTNSGVGTVQQLTATDGTEVIGGVVRAFGGASLTISNATISQGAASGSAGGGGIGFGGSGSLNVLDSTVSGNTVGPGGTETNSSGGGGILIEDGNGNLVVTRSDVTGNSITESDNATNGISYGGGGIKVNSGGNTAAIIDSTVSGNSGTTTDPQDQVRGGGVEIPAAQDDMTVRASTISGNTLTGGTSSYGAGIEFTDGSGADDTLTLENATLSGNSASGSSAVNGDNGGGIAAFDGITKLVFSTISGNTADLAEGIYYQGQAASGSSFQPRASVVSETTSACLSQLDQITSQNYNVQFPSAGPCNFNQANDSSGTNPNLGGLFDNGGPTMTHAVPSVSVALNRVPVAACLDSGGVSALTSDQRGAPRPDPQGGTNCESGSYERDQCSGVLVNFVGSGNPDQLQGTGGADGIMGLGGADEINGFGGADAVCAGAGNDTIDEFPDGAADQFLGEGNSDTVDFQPIAAANYSATVSTAAGGSAGGPSIGADTMNSVENARGGMGNETFTSVTENAANTLDGSVGDDTLEGKGGVDTLLLGPGTDTVLAQDATTDTINCTGGGPDTGAVDTTPAETYVSCDPDGDGLVDFFDSCPTQAGTQAGCPPPPTAGGPTSTSPTVVPTTASKKCKKKKRRSAVAAKKKCRKKR